MSFSRAVSALVLTHSYGKYLLLLLLLMLIFDVFVVDVLVTVVVSK